VLEEGEGLSGFGFDKGEDNVSTGVRLVVFVGEGVVKLIELNLLIRLLKEHGRHFCGLLFQSALQLVLRAGRQNTNREFVAALRPLHSVRVVSCYDAHDFESVDLVFESMVQVKGDFRDHLAVSDCRLGLDHVKKCPFRFNTLPGCDTRACFHLLEYLSCDG